MRPTPDAVLERLRNRRVFGVWLVEHGGLTGKDAAEATGVDAGTVSRWLAEAHVNARTWRTGRPRADKRTLNVTVDAAILERLDVVCHERVVGRGLVVGIALEDLFDRLERDSLVSGGPR